MILPAKNLQSATLRRKGPTRLYLKEIYLSGFKSFGEPTTVQLAPSFTAVVGPNGTGKSNLTDAVRWALSTGRLADGRAERRDEVLFAGSPTRRAAGLCEVRLTFDNHDRQLPLEAEEVEIVRRLYRQGDTEYRLQGVTCRARDVERLIAHLGLAEGYAWIGQGRVEEVVSQDPNGRRRLLEDASGAFVYRERRREAVHELARGDQEAEIERARLEELEAQMPDLRRDARLASAASELRARIATLEIGLGHRRIERLRAQLQRATEREAAAGESSRSGAQAIGRYEALSARIATALEGTAARGARREALAASVEDRLHAAAAQAAAASERERSALTRHGESQERLRRAEETHEAHQSAYAAASLQLSQAESELREAGAAGAEAMRALARMPQIEAALAAASRDAADLEPRAAELSGVRAVREQEAGAAADALQAAREAELSCHTSASAARAAEQEARQAYEAAERREAAFEDAVRAAERHAPAAVRAFLRESEAGRIEGVLGTLGRLVQPKEPRLALALATALGGAASDIVVEGEAVARQGIEWLRRASAGRATFLPLGALSPAETAAAPRVTGCLGVLSSLCDYPAAIEDAVRLRLGRTLVAEDLGAAQRAAEATGRRLRVVTLDGQVVQVGGALTGGQAVQVAAAAPPPDAVRAARAEFAEREASLRAAGAALTEALSRERQAAGAQEEALRALERAAGAAQAARRDHEQVLARVESARAERERLLEEFAQAKALAPGQHAQAAQQASLVQAVAQEETRRLAAELSQGSEVLAELRASAETAEGSLETARREAESARGLRESAAAWRDVITAQRRRGQRLDVTLRTLERLVERAMRQVAAASAGAEEQAVRLREEAVRVAEEIREAERALREGHGADALTRAVAPMPSQAEEALAKARRDLQEMGGAPPDAPERLREAEDRFSQLQERLADLSAAKATLVEVLAQADRAVADRLQHGMRVVGERFTAMAAALFGEGAKARLVAVAQGIDIEVELPGKEAVRLNWLSGGERALTAIAFLFALSALRPPPFYLLDEIEASLDERNVERFAQFLRRQAGRQLIVVTHQRPTMEAADQLIGTTMQERGITLLAAVRLEGEPSDDLGQVAQGS